MNKKQLDISYLDYKGELPDEFTIPKEHMPRVYDQGNGREDKTCSGIALTLIAEVFYKQYTDKDTKLSISYTYCKHRPKEHEDDNGTFNLEYAANGIVTGGTCAFSDMPNFIDVNEGCAYIHAHPELEEKAKPIADIFKGYISLKSNRNVDTFENIKRALVKTGLPIYGAMDGHAVVFVGYKGNCVKYRDWCGNETLWLLKYTKIKEAYAFIMADKKIPFIDVPDYYWGVDGVTEAYELGLMQGTSDTTFEPSKTVTRGELATALVNMYKVIKRE